MIRGLDLFREHFADYRKEFVLIGGVACHEWLSTQGLEFRATKDMDMVLIVEALDSAFVKRFWEFIGAGKYQVRQRAEDGRQLYRFAKPENKDFPAMIEIFSRKPHGVNLVEGQHIVPVKLDEDSASLSAILLNDDYYSLIRQQHNEEKNLPFANPASLIPLKARAYLDLAERAAKREPVKDDDSPNTGPTFFALARRFPVKQGRRSQGRFKTTCGSFFRNFPLRTRKSGRQFRKG